MILPRGRCFTSPCHAFERFKFKYSRSIWLFMTSTSIEHQVLQELQAIRKLLEEIDKNINVITLRSQHRMVVGGPGVW